MKPGVRKPLRGNFIKIIANAQIVFKTKAFVLEYSFVFQKVFVTERSGDLQKNTPCCRKINNYLQERSLFSKNLLMFTKNRFNQKIQKKRMEKWTRPNPPQSQNLKRLFTSYV